MADTTCAYCGAPLSVLDPGRQEEWSYSLLHGTMHRWRTRAWCSVACQEKTFLQEGLMRGPDGKLREIDHTVTKLDALYGFANLQPEWAFRVTPWPWWHWRRWFYRWW